MSLGHAPLKRDLSGQAINLRAKRERSRLPDKEPAPARAGALRPSWFFSQLEFAGVSCELHPHPSTLHHRTHGQF
jgi:hypothetical protein